MLYLGGGMRQVKVAENQSLYVFPDFSDRTQFYYLPNFPHIARMEDGAPAIRLLVFREDLDTIDENDPEAVGFLSLDVDLAWDPDLIDKAAKALRSEDQLQSKPRLTPIFFHKGSVKLMLLDAVTPDGGTTGPAGEAKPTEFVTRIMGAGSPSLFGDNRAIFQASLSKKGAAALSEALDGVTPIGVVYSLTFAGLQPAYHIKASVDWHKVYTHFSEHENTNLLFYEKDIQKSIDKLVEEKVIKFDVTVEGIGADAMDADRESAMNVIRQMIFEKFFEASIKRVDAVGDSTAEDIVDTLTHLARNSFTFGVGYSYQRKEVTIDELRTLDLDFSARRATERTIYPQAHMYNLLKGSGLTKDKLVTIVDPDKVWKVLPFEIVAAAAWEADGIAGVTVDIEYKDGGSGAGSGSGSGSGSGAGAGSGFGAGFGAGSGATRSKSVFLDKQKPKITYRDWMDRTSGSEFQYKYEVVFQDGAVPGPKPKVNSGPGWIKKQGTVLMINPRDLYEAVQLEVMAVPEFPFARWPAVQAVVRYRTDDGAFEHFEDGVLTAKALDFKTAFRVDKTMQGRREVRLTYIGASGEKVETPWMPMLQDQWVVDDPHPNKLVVRAVVAGNRANIANLLVDLEYSDPANGIHESGMLSFEEDKLNMPLSWTVNLADPAKRRYRYRMTMVTKEGDFLQTGWIGTDAPSLPVGEVYVRRLSVEIVTGTLARGVEGVEVAVAYDDVHNDVHDAQTFKLGPNSRAEWQVQLKDSGRRAYKVTTTWIRSDGFNRKVGPTTTTETFLSIPGQPPDA